MVESKRISAIKFGILSPDVIRRLSATAIISDETYDEDGLPIEGGLMDRRLGTIEPGQKCRTCGNTMAECPGHFGHIELARPVIHVGYVKTIQEILRATCRRCGRILLPQDEVEKNLKLLKKLREKWPRFAKRLTDQLLKKAQRPSTCPHCGEKQYKIRLEKPTTFYEERKEGVVKLSPIEVRSRLERIPDEDVELLGLDPKEARPEWMVLTVLPVPPITVRPSILLESSIRAEDDLTHKLVDIVRINSRLRENIEAGAPQLIIEDLWDLLQYHVTTYFDNEVPGVPPAKHRSGRPLRTLAQRLKGKEGRFRGHLSGKRVDFSARTVISPDPNLSINEVGVPVEIAKILTIPERVTPWNIEELRGYVINGPEKWPGANYIIRPDGRRVDLRFVKDRKALAETLAPGFIVERHLKDGDVVLFNRQPSLHRMSIMAHIVKVLPGRTFRLNLTVCVAGDAKVLLDGVQEKISELESCWRKVKVSTSENYSVKLTRLKAFWKLNARAYGKKCYRIVTETGREVVATEDHPFYTQDGIKPAGKLKVGDYVIVYPADFPEVERRDDLVISEEHIVRVAGSSKAKKIVEELKERSLLPLKLSDPRITAIARIVGYMFGDGTLMVGKDSRAVFKGKLEDLEKIAEDVKSLGYVPEPIKSMRSDSVVRGSDGSALSVRSAKYYFEVKKKSFCILLKALGCPDGDKVESSYRVPVWIRNGPLHVKKEFLAAYFGSKLSKPKIVSKRGKLFEMPVFKISKLETLLESGLEFVEDIRMMLREFNVESRVRVEDGTIRRDGLRTKIVKATIISYKEFFGRIGYAYNREAEELARLAYGYLKFKETYLEGIGELLQSPSTVKRGELVQIATIGGTSSYLYAWRKRRHSRVGASNFSDFREWVKERSVGGGFIKERIVRVEEAHVDAVYDVTTESDTHNFLVNGFLTSNCPPYNADFDGDEMNLHVPQTEEARAEARVLMLVQNQVLSPRYGGPIIGGLQDYISGAYLLTSKSTLLKKEDVVDLLGATKYEGKLPEPAILSPKVRWTGKQVMSLFLPKGFNYSLKANVCVKCKVCTKEECQYDAYVVIRNGELLAGVFDKKSIGAQVPESVLHRVIKDYGFESGRRFIDYAFKMFIRYLEKRGFTMKLDDVEVPEEAIMKIRDIIQEAEDKVRTLIESYVKGELEPIPGRTLDETLEMRIMEVLAEARDAAGEVAQEYLDKFNHAYIMARAGARGNILNLTQMAASLGQQSVRGERIVRGYTNRTLPHFKVGDRGPYARGFVASSFRTGLSPIEMFFHAAGGREGLVDTAVRTSQSGYMQRRLINALQDIRVEYDGTVRLPDGTIIQFAYGEDGVDPVKSDHGKAVNIDKILEKVLGAKVVE